ncbi:hypothetical protein [Flavobacterium seoulense]|uniref:Uncharacterized protein n=1 Tax=Flavobacterium seoulense TaxID=1492738 RepID=A0A066X0M3_9FLAO|nr:hypothetical protein [Flavobacterium seoulense]KDN56470.1 hypothetical protein FEM21_04890 [Flavobacterium seoulense]
MYGTLPLILIVFPLLFQILLGRKAIGGDIKLKFTTVSIISLLLQVALSIIAFAIASQNLEAAFKAREFRCGMGLLGFVALSLFFTFFLLITMLIQYFIKRSYDNKH